MSDDLSVTFEQLTRWLTLQFSDAHNISVRPIGKPSGGYSNETWLLDLIWTRKGIEEVKPLVMRLAPKGNGIFPDYDLHLQYRCMAALEGSGVPVPSVLIFCDDIDLFGVPFYLMERVEGVAPIENPPYHQVGWLHEMTREDQSAVWREALDVLVALAKVDWKAKGFACLDRREQGDTPLAQMLHYYRSYLEWVEQRGRPYPLLRKALEWVEHHQPVNEPTTLCWGDAKLGNCLYRGTRCVAALDWEKPHLGNPVSDLAWSLMLDRALSTSIGIARLPGFWDYQASMTYWSSQTGFSVEDLPYYEFLSAFKFSVIMASITRIFIQRGWVPLDTDMDVRNAGTAVLMDYAREQGIDLFS